MATLGDLKDRIIAETLRDDLADDMAAQLTLIIQKSIDHYAANRWWFNEKRAFLATTAGSPLVTLPTDFRYLDELMVVIGGVSYVITIRQPVEIDERYTAPVINGQPTEAAILQNTIYFWPTPSVVYPVQLRYVADVAPALVYTDNTSSNFWTNQGQDLITARAKLRLYRDYLSAQLQDPRVIQANNQEEEAYSRLRSEHNRRITTGHVRAGW